MKLTSSLGLLLASVSLFGTACASSANTGYAPSYAGRAVYTTSSSSAPATASAEAVATTGSSGGGYGSYVSAQQPAAPVAPSASADGVASSTPRGVEVSPSVRPGLATEWGESRYSSMSYAPFVRASAQPFDTAMIHYNDARGASMQAAYRASTAPVLWAGAYHDGVRLSLRDESGAPLPGYHAGDRLYVVGNAGQRYTILIENMTPVRFEAVVSVDGLDVINGRAANFTNRGYIIPAHGRVVIDGFRQNQDTVAAFRFGSVEDSYAAQTGDARNVGVVGLGIFAERGAVLDLERNEVQLRDSANPFPGEFSAPPPRRSY